MIYQKQWQFLKKSFESGNLAHAFLFSGQDIESIKSFTKDFIKLINCLYYKSHGRKVCGTDKKDVCRNCRMIENGSFPDLLTLKSSDSRSSVKNEKDIMEVSIEQVRRAQNFLGYKSYYGAFKSVIIENAERMNSETQSCFLKTLEEPKGKTVIFLLTSKPDFLLPTIFSRCQHIKFFYKVSNELSESEKKTMQELKKIIYSDLAEKFKYAKNVNLEEGNFNKILNILQKYFRQLLLSKISAINFTEKKYPISKIKNNLELIEDLIYKSDTANVNKKLALEILLMEI